MLQCLGAGRARRVGRGTRQEQGAPTPVPARPTPTEHSPVGPGLGVQSPRDRLPGRVRGGSGRRAFQGTQTGPAGDRDGHRHPTAHLGGDENWNCVPGPHGGTGERPGGAGLAADRLYAMEKQVIFVRNLVDYVIPTLFLCIYTEGSNVVLHRRVPFLAFL